MIDQKGTPRVAMLGLGLMGQGMAQQLRNAAMLSGVYNRSADKAVKFAEQGVLVGKTPCAAAAGADVIVSMVAHDAASRLVWLGPDGALSSVMPGTICIEASTLSPQWIGELKQAVEDKKCALLDAPVTGSRVQAASGELRFLVGGDHDVLEKARAVLMVMGKTIEHVGPTGAGALLKLINNFLCGVQTASMAEALVLIERGGLDREKALEILMSGAPASPMIKTVLPRMTAQDYTPFFHIDLMAKDLRYAHDAGKAHGVELTTALAAFQVFQKAIECGHAGKDLSVVVESL